MLKKLEVRNKRENNFQGSSALALSGFSRVYLSDFRNLFLLIICFYLAFQLDSALVFSRYIVCHTDNFSRLGMRKLLLDESKVNRGKRDYWKKNNGCSFKQGSRHYL